MRWFVMGIFLAFSSLAFADAEISAGLGYQLNTTHEVNPDYPSAQSVGQLYFSYARHPWSGLLELGRTSSDSRLGNYEVETVSYRSMVWGRYEPWTENKWSAFASAGFGWNYHNVTTTFGAARDERSADGGAIVGIGIGLMTTLYQHWNIEGEMRVSKAELSADSALGFNFRSGYTF